MKSKAKPAPSRTGKKVAVKKKAAAKGSTDKNSAQAKTKVTAKKTLVKKSTPTTEKVAAAKKKPVTGSKKKTVTGSKKKTATDKVTSPAKKRSGASVKETVPSKSIPKKSTRVKVAADNVTKIKPVPKKAPKRKTTAAAAAPTRRTRTRKASAGPRRQSQPAKPFPYSADGVIMFTPYPIRKGDEYMDDDQVEHFRSILYGWKHQLMEEVDRTLHHMQDEAANFPDPNDRATQESEFTLELRTRDRERKLIKKIDEAVASLETGDYGFCETCGIEIGIRRLEARPTATLCIDCKVLDEIRERQMG